MKPIGTRSLPSLALAASAAFAISFSAQNAAALDKLKVSKAVATAMTFAPLEVGVMAGTWKKNGLELQIQAFRGASQNMQALASKSVEIALSSGPSLAFIEKGVPAKGVAAFANAPHNMALIGFANAGVDKIEKLRGKKVGVTSAGSLTNWLVAETNRRRGWTSNALQPTPLGGARTQYAAAERGEIQGRVGTYAQALQHEADGSGSLLVNFGDVVDDFITHVIYARNDVIAERPEVVQKFVNGWWATIAYMDKNREQSIKWVAKTVRQPEAAVARAYPTIIKQLTAADGSFDPKALKTLSRSFVDLKILSYQPDMSKLYTTQFLPPKPVS